MFQSPAYLDGNWHTHAYSIIVYEFEINDYTFNGEGFGLTLKSFPRQCYDVTVNALYGWLGEESPQKHIEEGVVNFQTPPSSHFELCKYHVTDEALSECHTYREVYIYQHSYAEKRQGHGIRIPNWLIQRTEVWPYNFRPTLALLNYRRGGLWPRNHVHPKPRLVFSHQELVMT